MPTALITGATDGVGRLVAKQLGAKGFRMLVHGRNRERGESLVREIEAAGGKASFIAADLSALAGVRAGWPPRYAPRPTSSSCWSTTPASARPARRPAGR